MDYGTPAAGPGSYVALRDPSSSHRRSYGAVNDFEDGEVQKPFIAAYENQAFAPSAPPAPPGGLSDGADSQPAPSDDPKGKAKSPSKHPRLQSLDMFRGLTIGWMIMADDSGDYSNHLLDHSPWDHVTFADFVFPFFVFITGCSVALSFTKYKSRLQAVSHSFERFAKLFLIGLIVQGGNFPTQYPLYTLRIPGILQRIGFCYLCACLVEILVPTSQFDFDETEPPASRRNLLSLYLRFWTHWAVFLAVTVMYILLMFTTQVPGCDGLGHLDEQCNAAGYWDQKILGLNHMYGEPTFNRAPECSLCSPGYCPYPSMPAWCSMAFDPEGVVSSISAVGSALIGLHFGHVIMRCKSHQARLAQWLPLAAFCLCFGFAVQGMGFPFNKNLWSTSYVFFMAGIAGFGLSFFYITVDILGTGEGPLSKVFVWMFQPLRWMGMNAILVFVMAASDVFDTLVSYIYWQTPDQNLINMLQTTWLPNAFGDDGAILAYALGKIGFWMVVSGVLHYKGIYFKV